MDILSEVHLRLREKFLAYDSGSDDRERFLIFSNKQNLDVLKNTPQWHAATKLCPALFYQLYTVHGLIIYNTAYIHAFEAENKRAISESSE